MSLAGDRYPFVRCTGAALALLSFAVLPARVLAQCTLTSPPVQFEPNPPGATRPIAGAPLGQLSSGFSSNLGLYRNASGANRVLMIETFGYSTLNITDPVNPSAIRYDDLRYDAVSSTTNPIAAHGDGQNYIQSIGVSADGQRVAFSVTGPAEPTWHTLVGRPDGEGFGMWGDFGESRASGAVVQKVGSRYIAYATYFSTPAIAADVTALPTQNAQFSSLNLASETTTFPAGYSPMLAGTYLVYMTFSGVEVVDAANPGPKGAITSGYRSLLITAVPGDTPARVPRNFTAAVDPLDPTKLWVLVELAARTGENSPSYALVSVTKDGAGNLLAPVAAGPPFRVPSLSGETWGLSGGSASLVASNYQLFALMWATRSAPTQQFVLYSTTASTWAQPQATLPVAVPGFGLAITSAAAAAGTGASVYQYLPTGPRAFVVPLTCVALDAPAVSILSVTNGGAAVPDGGTAFLGDTLTVAPAVLPSPAIKPLSDWRFDFDFHAGSAAEDNGTSPRIRNLDNAQLGNPAAPPAAVTLVGPCDPQRSGIPATGAGCWNSVLTNASVGGPDFTGSEPAGTVKPLKIALEAANQVGIQNTAVFTVNWKVPAVSVASNQLFLAQPLVSASEGQPLPTGFRWWFGNSPTSLSLSACSTSTCVPTLDTKGTHYFWLTATYANGYVSPDYNGTTRVGLPYAVIDFAPAFTVNGSASGPISIDTGLNLQIGNGSMHSPGVTGAYSYSVCQIPSGQTTCAASYGTLTGMTDPPTGGTPPTYTNVGGPATAGSYLFRIRVDFTGGTAFWPDPAGVNGFPITVTAPTPEMHIFVNGYDPCGPIGCIVNRVNARVGDVLTAYSYVNGFPDSGAGSLAWDFSAAASPTTGSGNGVVFSYAAPGTYDLVLIRNGIRYAFPGSAVILPQPPLNVTISATPTPAYAGNPVQFGCSATGGTGPYTYTWSVTDGGAGSGSPFAHVLDPSGSYVATCTAYDPVTHRTGQNTVTVNVTLPPGVGGPYALFALTPCRLVDTRNPVGLRGGPAIQRAGTTDRVFSVASVCGIPADAKALSANVTVTNVTAPGSVSIYRGNGSQNGTSTASLVPGRTRANNAMLQLAMDGSGTVKVQNTSLGTFDLIIDVNGYFR